MGDFMAMLAGLRDCLRRRADPGRERGCAARSSSAGRDRLKFHQRLPGDHKGNSIMRFFWKGAGIGDDK